MVEQHGRFPSQSGNFSTEKAGDDGTFVRDFFPDEDDAHNLMVNKFAPCQHRLSTSDPYLAPSIVEVFFGLGRTRMYALFLLFCFAGYDDESCYESQDPRQFAVFEDCNDTAISMQSGPDIADDRGGRLNAMTCRLSR